MIFGVLNPEKIMTSVLYICPPYLYTVATLHWEIQKSHFFQQYYSYILQVILSDIFEKLKKGGLFCDTVYFGKHFLTCLRNACHCMDIF